MVNSKELFETLHTDYYNMVYQMCMGFMKGHEELAKDLSQETFINIWRSLEKFRGASGYKTWIYRITVNTCLKYIRDNKHGNQVFIDPDSTSVEEAIHQHENKKSTHELYRAIGQLGELDRLIIMMVLEGLKYTEIAEVVGLSEGNLRVKVHRIKKILKNILEHE